MLRKRGREGGGEGREGGVGDLYLYLLQSPMERMGPWGKIFIPIFSVKTTQLIQDISVTMLSSLIKQECMGVGGGGRGVQGE